MCPAEWSATYSQASRKDLMSLDARLLLNKQFIKFELHI